MVQILLAYGTSLVLFAILIRSVDIESVAEVLLKTDISDYLLAAGFYFAAFMVSAVKWRIFLPGTSFFDLARWTLISLFFIMITPGQIGGDVVKVYGLRKIGINSSDSTACAIIDKVTGFGTLMVVTLTAITMSSFRDSVPDILVVVSSVFLFMILLFYFSSLRLKWLIAKLPEIRKKGVVSKLLLFVTNTSVSLNESGRRYPLVILSLGLSAFLYLFFAAEAAVLARTLVPSVALLDWVWIAGMLAVVMLFPFSVGGLGVREGGYVALLSLLSVSTERALALSLTLFSIQLIGALVGAVLFLYENHRMNPEHDESKTSVYISNS